MKKTAYYLFYGLLAGLTANGYLLVSMDASWLLVLIPLFLTVNLFAGFAAFRKMTFRLRTCYHGALLLFVFEISTIMSILFHLGWLLFYPVDMRQFLFSTIFCLVVQAVLFWNGILCVYLTSVQLGVRYRLLGALCGMIPIVNILILNKLLRIIFREVRFEQKKQLLDIARKDEKICATRYPILLVHGVFFRDSHFLNYWGRIPKSLEKNGARIYYGKQPSAASVAESAEFLAVRIRYILKKTGCEKVNVIAHSKGGLDTRYAMEYLGMAPYIASLTTINTPHRGCEFADFLLNHASQKLKDTVSQTYNKALNKLGEDEADFMAAVQDLTASACVPRDQQMAQTAGVFCQSVGSVMPKASGGKFPMNYCYHLVKFFNGPNDGLVSEDSFAWGERYTLLEPKGSRGISHADMIDLNRENIEEFDVREFYVDLVHDLKERGL